MQRPLKNVANYTFEADKYQYYFYTFCLVHTYFVHEKAPIAFSDEVYSRKNAEFFA